MAMFWFERNRCTKKMKSGGISDKHDVKDKLFGSTLRGLHKFTTLLIFRRFLRGNISLFNQKKVECILACVAGGISMRVLYEFPSRLRPSLRVATRPPRKYPGHKNPTSYVG